MKVDAQDGQLGTKPNRREVPSAKTPDETGQTNNKQQKEKNENRKTKPKNQNSSEDPRQNRVSSDYHESRQKRGPEMAQDRKKGKKAPATEEL